MTVPLLSISALHKRYAVPVLRGVELTLHAGEVHALLGANGAGKTTLCNVICGLTQADSGRMLLGGQPHAPGTVNDAEAAGIRIVMQELNLIDNLSIGENLYLTSLPRRRGLIDFRQLFEKSAEVLEANGLAGLDPRREVGTLGIGQRQLIEIARVLLLPCRLLILDEPTAALTDPQIELLFEKLALLKAGGTGIIYVSHRMNEIRRIADRISVLRDGQSITESATAELNTDDIVRMMSGQVDKRQSGRRRSNAGAIAANLRGIGTRGLLRGVSLDIRCGEILGIAGLIGAGRTELLRAVFGADTADAGYISLGDDPHRYVFRSPEEAVGHGIGLIPEDRKQQGLLLGQSVMSNVTLASLPGFRRATGLIDGRRECAAVERYRKSLQIDCTDLAQPVAQLSGGNQQKVSIAKWLMRDCRILLFDEPTRGIDTRTKEAIYELLDELAAEGRAIVVVSSESRELTRICDRIAVLSNGRLAEIFDRGEWTAAKITAASFSAFTSDPADSGSTHHA